MQTISSAEHRKLETPLSETRQVTASSSQLPIDFCSILFVGPRRSNIRDQTEPPAFFHDLNLEQIVDSITQGREEYNLKPYFYTRLPSFDDIHYRQEIMQELESEVLFADIKSFSERMRLVRGRLATAKNWHYKYSNERWFLDAVQIYCAAITELQRTLEDANPNSRGLRGFRQYLTQYANSELFRSLHRESEVVRSGLSAICYCVRIKGGSVTVSPFDSEIDYTVVVEETFAKFKQGEGKDYLCKSKLVSGMNHVEAAILDRVVHLNPEPFRALDDFCAQHENFLETPIADFDREIQFYLAYLEYATVFKRTGLKFCYPELSKASKDVWSREGFDLALADKLTKEHGRVVCNDFSLSGPEHIFVVTGPNQGGKTTFARVFGQLHYLASLGCPVPGSEARLLLFDQLFTHFEHEEDVTTLRGKLQDDLVRVHRILDHVTPNSIVVINEIFSSASVKDGIHLGRKVLERLTHLGCLCVCVTFLDQLASFNEKTVSVVAAVAPEDRTLRTFKVERRRADGLAYALAIAEKYHLTYNQLKERLKA